MEAEVGSVMAEDYMVVEAVRSTSIILTPTRVVDMMKAIRNNKYKYKFKSVERDTAVIRVVGTAPYLAVVLISEA